MDSIWFNSWDSIIRIICITPLAYIAIVILLRVSGKKTLSKMNAFDLVVTIALGSVLASVALYQDIPLADGVTAFIVFIGIQFLFSWMHVRFKSFRGYIASKPTLIFYKGNFDHSVMKKERLSIENIKSEARQKGYSTLDGIDVIILETTGDIAIIEKIDNHAKTIFENVDMGSQNSSF